MESEKSMKTPRRYGQAPKSKARKATKHPQARFEELTRRYLPLIGGTVWATYTVLFQYRNRKSNQCFPRYQTVADRRGVSRRTIIRHVSKLVAFGLVEKEHRFYDNLERNDCFGQRSNKYWFAWFQPDDVTPRVTDPSPMTSFPPNLRNTKHLETEKAAAENPAPEACDHPWGIPMDYPHEGFWRCNHCGELYKR